MSISSDAARARRQSLVEERATLIAEKEALDRRQQQLAARMASINHRLTELRDELWPLSKYRMGWILRRPPVGGPPPIPRPAKDATPLSGPQLRYAALAIALRARRPITLTEIHRAIVLGGYRVDSSAPVKTLGDALGYEHRRGTAVRVERGTYRIGEINAGDRRRIARSFPRRTPHPITTRPGGIDQPFLDEAPSLAMHPAQAQAPTRAPVPSRPDGDLFSEPSKRDEFERRSPLDPCSGEVDDGGDPPVPVTSRVSEALHDRP
jgi:hypothetical protein